MPAGVHVLACVFGLGSWVAINGLWVELPLLVAALPEGWGLPSQLTVIIQLANVGPLLVALGQRACPGRVREAPVIVGVLGVGVLACMLLSALWRCTTHFLGRPRSSAFLALTFFLALVDCTSSVTFLPFMMQLPAQYVSSFFVGEGLSGLLPGLLALAQGVGAARCVNVSSPGNNSNLFDMHTKYLPPNFPPEVFFGLLAVMMMASLAAFGALLRLSGSAHPSSEQLVRADSAVASVCGGVDNPVAVDTPVAAGDGKVRDVSEEQTQRLPLLARPHSAAQRGCLFLLVFWANAATNGLLPSVQTYSCLPYGHLAYHLSAVLSSLANPLACLIAMLCPSRSLPCLVCVCVLGTAFGSYNMAMAVLSPCPLLHNSPLGVAIIVLSWVFFTGLLSYVKVMVGVILRDESHSALVWCGVAVQAGSLLGSVTMFPLVNVYNLFQAGDACSTQCPL